MRKMLNYLLSLLALLALCVLTTGYIIDIKQSQSTDPFFIEENQNTEQLRYQLIFGQITAENRVPSLSEPGLTDVTPHTRYVCFKHDRKTGVVWEYIHYTYADSNHVISNQGFREVLNDPFSIDITDRKAKTDK